MVQEGKYLYEIEIERIQSLMGCSPINEQVLTGIPFGYGSLKAYNWFSTFNKHDWLTFVDITSGLLGMFPTPVAPILLGISLAACEADGALYISEGDPYMGGLVLSFCLIPLGEWIRILPGAKSVISKGKQYVIDLLKKAKSLSGKKVLNTSEKAIIKEADTLIKSLTEKADDVAKLTQKYYVSRVMSNIIKTGGKLLFDTVLLLSKMTWSIGKLGLTIGGIIYTFDEIYLALYATDEEKMKIRNNSSFGKLAKFMKDPQIQKYVEEEVGKWLFKHQEIFNKNPELLGTVDPVKSAEVDKRHQEIMKELQDKNQSANEIKSPSIQDVIDGKIDSKTKKPYTIEFGQKGESVRKVQEMLEILEFGNTLKGYNTKKSSVDGHFGENTFYAVVLFQWKNDLAETGIIDSNTLKQLTAKSNEKKQENEK